MRELDAGGLREVEDDAALGAVVHLEWRVERHVAAEHLGEAACGIAGGGSILTTSAPQSASSPPAAGPATHTPSSTTRTPSSGPLTQRTVQGTGRDTAAECNAAADA